jgi:hypothetical protein
MRYNWEIDSIQCEVIGGDVSGDMSGDASGSATPTWSGFVQIPVRHPFWGKHTVFPDGLEIIKNGRTGFHGETLERARTRVNEIAIRLATYFPKEILYHV